jgi:hypothetical protein
MSIPVRIVVTRAPVSRFDVTCFARSQPLVAVARKNEEMMEKLARTYQVPHLSVASLLSLRRSFVNWDERRQ